MPREVVLGNQRLLVNIDGWLQVRDIFYPHVGEENHVQGKAHRMAVQVDNSFSWLDGEAWERDLGYEEETLVSNATIRNEELGLELSLRDTVDCDEDIFMRRIQVDDPHERDVRLLFFHDFCISGTDVGDTAFYDPRTNSITHYKRKRYFLCNAIREATCASCQAHGDIDSYTMGTGDDIWEDMHDGYLDNNPVAHGNVSSALSIPINIEEGQGTVYYWIAVGKNRGQVNALNEELMSQHPDEFFRGTERCWRGVANAHGVDFKDLGGEAEELYKRSVLTAISNIDRRGAVLASNDSDILKFNKDNYSYCWPRDGALSSLGLDKAGYHAYTKGFFEFCADVQADEGCLLHKYNPDRSVGSTWHPWVKDGKPHLPIQEDETALPLYAGWQHYERTGDEDFARSFYDDFVQDAAEFMVEHRDGSLPKPCYDLWEEREGVLTYTVATVIAGLNAAARFAEHFDNTERARRYEKASGEIKAAMLDELWYEDEGRFARMKTEEGLDMTPESSTFAVFALDVLPADDERVVRNMQSLRDELWVDTEIGGFARYTDDYYQRVTDEEPGNPWFITTMWYGKWQVARAASLDELQKAKDVITWVVDRATSTGMLPEQLHPYTGEPLSVSPLTWSHSTYVDLVQDYLDKYEELQDT